MITKMWKWMLDSRREWRDVCSVERRVEKWSREEREVKIGREKKAAERKERSSEWVRRERLEREERKMLNPVSSSFHCFTHSLRSFFFQTHSLCREYFSLLNFNSGARKTEGVFSEGTISLEIRALSFSRKFYLALFEISSFSSSSKIFRTEIFIKITCTLIIINSKTNILMVLPEKVGIWKWWKDERRDVPLTVSELIKSWDESEQNRVFEIGQSWKASQSSFFPLSLEVTSAVFLLLFFCQQIYTTPLSLLVSYLLTRLLSGFPCLITFWLLLCSPSNLVRNKGNLSSVHSLHFQWLEPREYVCYLTGIESKQSSHVTSSGARSFTSCGRRWIFWSKWWFRSCWSNR